MSHGTSTPPPLRAIASAMAVALALTVTVAAWATTPRRQAAAGALPTAANVFVAPPGSAGMGTSGSDSDSVNCRRFDQAVPTPPGGSGAGCASFQKAYALANPGDTVAFNWNGAWATNQKVFGTKATSAGCDYPGDLSACITFTRLAGSTASLTPTTGGSAGYGNFLICANYVALSDIVFNRATWTEQSTGDTITDTTWEVGTGDNSCQPAGAPPHDVLVRNVISNGQFVITGGAWNVYVLGGAEQNALNFTNQFGGGALVNGTYVRGVHDSTIDGVAFDNITGNDSAHHHMDCLHMDGSGDHNTVRNSSFTGPSCMYQSIRVEAAANGSPVSNYQTHILIENNVFDVPNPLGFDCHDPGCQITNDVVRFNTFKQSGFMPTNDCAQVAGNTCTQAGNTFTGNVFLTACPSNAKIYGLGWTTSFDVTTQAAGGICAGDTTSAFGAAISLNGDGSLNGVQKAVDFVPTTVGAPAADKVGVARPQGPANDAGAFEQAAADRTAPAVTVPADMNVEATGPAGATATFVATATDPDDAAGPVTCRPSAGSTFPLGTTTVSCSSTDTHGNTGTATFRVTVSDTMPPTSPKALTVVDGSQQTQVAISWTASTDAVGVSGYDISLDGARTLSVPPNATSATVTGLAWGKHVVTVVALDAASNASPPANLVLTSTWN